MRYRRTRLLADYLNRTGVVHLDSDIHTLESTVAYMRDLFLQSHGENRKYSGASGTSGTSGSESIVMVSISGVATGDEAEI